VSVEKDPLELKVKNPVSYAKLRYKRYLELKDEQDKKDARKQKKQQAQEQSAPQEQ